MLSTQTIKADLTPFDYKNISLRLLRKDDLPETLLWRNTYRAFFTYSDEIDLPSHLKWFENYLQKNDDFIFIIENQLQEKLGQVALYDINWAEKSAQFGRFLVNPAFANQGYMSTACKASLLLARDVLELCSLMLEVKATNERAIRIYENCGFRFEKAIGQELLRYMLYLI